MQSDQQVYYAEVWEKVLQYLESNQYIDRSSIERFYRSSHIYSFTKNKIIIATKTIVESKILIHEETKILSAFIDLFDLTTTPILEIYCQTELDQQFPIIQDIQQATTMLSSDFQSMPIQTERTFENFVVGDCNRESQAAALACSLHPGQFFNPLFIYGNSGLGKTHLLMAIANHILNEDPSKNVYYTESLKFVETVVNAIRNNKIDEFKRFMYTVDVLIVDDIQFLAGKEKSHEIFFSIYNELVNNGKQICLASDRQPKDIKGLEDRLISRFSSGLSVGIDSPEFETSLAILQMKIKSSGYGINDVDRDGLNYIASNFSGNVRDLEGAWNRVLFYAIQFQPDGKMIRFDTVMSALKNQVIVSDKSTLSTNKIIKTVADFYGLTKDQILSKTRTKNIAIARHISIYLCRKMLDIPYLKIGDEFGGRDHSTIINACTKIEQQIRKDEILANAILDIEKMLKN